MGKLQEEVAIANRKLIVQELKSLKEEGLIEDFSNHQNNNASDTFVVHRKTDHAEVRISTNLSDEYELTLDGYYHEFTTYLVQGDNFESHVSWFMQFIKAFLRHDYHEIKYVNRKTGAVIYRSMVFNDKGLGRNTISGHAPAFFWLGRLLGWYRKLDQRTIPGK